MSQCCRGDEARRIGRSSGPSVGQSKLRTKAIHALLLSGGILLFMGQPAPGALLRTEELRKEAGRLQILVQRQKLQIHELEKDFAKARIQTQRELAQAKSLEKRIKELELQVGSATTTAPSVATAPATAPARPLAWTGSIGFIAYPARRTDSLGLVSSRAMKLTRETKGAKQIQLISLIPVSQLGRTSLQADASGGTVSFVHSGSAGQKKAIAALQLKADGLFWNWNAFSPVGMDAALTSLDEFLQTSVIKLRLDGRTVAAFQFYPRDVTVGRNRTARLPLSVSQMTLEKDTLGQNWEARSVGANELQFRSSNWTITVSLNTRLKKISTRWDLRAVSVTTADVRKAEKSYQEALKQLQDDPFLTTSSRTALKAKIASLRAQIEVLKNRRATLAARPVAVDTSKCTARIRGPNGVILYRIKVKAGER